MAIKKIRVRNFKSFKELDLELGNLNILIGANASGKSNFVEIFRFLRDIRNSGLDNAISLQGGIEYLRNMKADPSEIISLEVVSEQEDGFGGMLWDTLAARDIQIYEAVYRLAIRFDNKGPSFEVVEDTLTEKCRFLNPARQGEITLSNVNGEVNLHLNLPEELSKIQDIRRRLSIPKSLPPGFVLLDSSLPYMHGFSLDSISREISIFDLSRGILRQAVPMAAKAELEENGNNLAVVLKNILIREDEKRRLLNLVKYLLSFIDELDVEKLAGKFLLLKLRETYSDKYLPGFLVSDGTISMIALIIALYFDKKPVTIIEEPDRGIHPYLISKVVSMLEDASESKQIIVTTHDPEVVRYAKKEEVLLVSRNEEGFSSVCRPSEKEDVKIFLENGLRMEELYVDNFLDL